MSSKQRKSSSSSSVPAAAASSEAVVAPVVVSAVPEVKAEKPKVPRKPKATAAAAVAETPVAVASETVVVVSSEVAETEGISLEIAPSSAEELALQSAEFLTKISTAINHLTALKTEYKALEKKWSKELKQLQKMSGKRKRKAGERAPSGFTQATKISDELATFLSKPAGTEMARTAVTREINQYIRSNSLQDKENGRRIHPDGKLKGLLKLVDSDELTYFNLQKFLSPHFIKKVPVAEASA